MTLNNRLAHALLALIYSAWASTTLMRHFVGAPDQAMHFLVLSPALACLMALAGLLGESTWARRKKLPAGYPPSAIPMPLRVLIIAGVAFIDWRCLWMFFSWDGMLYLPAAMMLTLVLWRQKQTPRQALWAERVNGSRWGESLATRLSTDYKAKIRPRPPLGPY